MKKPLSLFGQIKSLVQDKDGSLTSIMLRGASGTFLINLQYVLINFFLTILLARLLGTHGYGSYVYAISWITLLGVVAKMGLEQVISREVASSKELCEWGRLGGLIRFTFVAIAAASLVCIVVAGALALVFESPILRENRDVLFLAFTLVPFNALLVWASAHQQGFSKVVLAQIPSMVILPISFLSFLGIYVLGSVPTKQLVPSFVLLMQLLASAVALGGALLLLRQTIGATIKHFTPIYEIRRWARSALRLVLVDSMYLLTMNIDILMLGSIAGAEEAGVYKIATRGADLVVYTLFIVSIPLAPIIARLYAARDYERLQRAITKTTRVACVAAIPIALLLVLFGEWFLALFGEGFVEGKPVLVILAVSQLFNAVTGPVGRLLIMTGHESQAAGAISVGAVANVVLNALLIPGYGIKGAAIATAISAVLWNGIMVWGVWSRLKLDPTLLGLKSTASLARP